MKTTVLLLSLLIFLGPGGIARADDSWRNQQIPQAMVRALMAKLQAVVPSGWKVSYEGEFHLIEITREAPTMLTFITIDSSPELMKPQMGQVEIGLRIYTLLTKREYAEQKAENAKTQTAMNKIHHDLGQSPTVHGIRQPLRPGIRISSKVPAENAKIEEYYRLESTLHRLPDGYFGNVSVVWESDIPTLGSYGDMPDDEAVREECKAVYNKLVTVPTKY